MFKVIKTYASVVPVKYSNLNLVVVFMIAQRSVTQLPIYIVLTYLFLAFANLVSLGKMVNVYSTVVKESAQDKLL